jgi:hypothetical protein
MNETFIRHEPINVNPAPISQPNKKFDLIKRELSLMSFDFESSASISHVQNHSKFIEKSELSFSVKEL